ncbi:MAG TPA: BON domain-containing protein [Rhodanobacteraceae bacterium]|nr:BON domain-containing protein [Rhodanobacteraceae bacterium]
MRNSANFRSGIFAAILVALAVAPLTQVAAQEASGSMQSSDQSVSQKASDTWITTKVKSELATTKGIKSTDISVTTNDGVVMLTGSVNTAHAKHMAEHVAMHVKGVKSVDASGLNVGVVAQ